MLTSATNLSSEVNMNIATVTDIDPSLKSEDKCKAIFFCDFCSLLQSLVDITNKTQRRDITSKKLDKIFSNNLKQNLTINDSMFPYLRLILPDNDSERGNYNLKEASIAKLYIKALHLDKKVGDGYNLLHWKESKVANSKVKNVYDFCGSLEVVLKSRIRSTASSYTLGDINTLLDELIKAVDEDSKLKIIQEKVIDKMSVQEQLWLMRIIFKDLKIGLKYEHILGRFYPNAKRRFDECSNLRIVCQEYGRILEIEDVGLKTLQHFHPMLAKGFNNSEDRQIESVENAMQNNPFVMDLKLDGERILCHKDNQHVTLFTRNGTDYTLLYRAMSDLLRELLPVNCILDGEILAWDGNEKNFMAFGENKTVAIEENTAYEAKDCDVTFNNHLGGLKRWMLYVVFDIVYIEKIHNNENVALNLVTKAIADAKQLFIDNNLSLSIFDNLKPKTGDITSLPFVVRRQLLKNLIAPLLMPERFELVEYRVQYSSDKQERIKSLSSYFEEVVNAKKEGLLVKDLTSAYLLGESNRRLARWVKMKPEYDNIRDLDLIVLGCYYGQGNSIRGQGVSRFLLGVRTQNNEYRTLCKVGTGYSFRELQEVREKMKPFFQEYDSNNPPEFLRHWKPGKPDDVPQLFINPKDSFIIQIKCAALVESNQFACGLTCRFPRAERIRFDKSVEEAMTLEDILEIKSQPTMKISNRDNTIDNGEMDLYNPISVGLKRGYQFAIQGKNHKRKKVDTTESNSSSTTRKLQSARTIDSSYLIKKVKEVKGIIFDGLCFYLHNMETFDGSNRRDAISKAIQENHGNIITILPTTNVPMNFKIVTDLKGSKSRVIQELIPQAKYDIIDYHYINDCIDAKKILPLDQKYFHSYSDETIATLRQTYDCFNDSYEEELVIEELNDLIDYVQTYVQNIPQEITRLEAKLKVRLTKNQGKKKSKESSLNPIVQDNIVEFYENELSELRLVLEDHNSLQKLKWNELCSLIDEEFMGLQY